MLVARQHPRLMRIFGVSLVFSIGQKMTKLKIDKRGAYWLCSDGIINGFGKTPTKSFKHFMRIAEMAAAVEDFRR